MEAGQILKIKKMSKEFQRGYGAGIDEMKDMNLAGIVHVVEGDLMMSRKVYYRYHGGEEISKSYIEGWIQAIRDAHKGVIEGRR